MSSYFTSILAKAQEIVSSATETAIDYVIDNPTTSALATATTAIGGTYLLRSSQLYQRHSTVINSIGVLTAVGGAYLGYSTVRPYLTNLMKAKEVLEKSNSKRMILSQEQLTAIDQTNIQSWVVTLDALRNSLVDTYNVDALFATINSVREKQRQLKLSDPKPLMPIFNHYRIHIFSRLVSSTVLTAAVRYFNGISVPVTFRYAELDRNLFDSTCLNDQQITQLTELEAKYANYQTDRQNNEKLTPEEAHLMHKFQTEFNSPSDGTFLRTLAQSAVTDVLNLVYQSTLTVLFPVVCQIVTAQLMTNDTPFSFSQIVQEYQAGKRAKDDLNALGYEKGEFFLESDSWISATLTSQDVMLCIERATVKAMNVLIQPSEWFIRVELDNNDDDNNNFDTTDTNPIAPAAQSTNSTQNKQKQPKCSTMPISDYILGYGYGNYQNATLREHNASRSGFTLLTPTEIDALHTHAVNMLDFSLLTTQHTASQTQSAQPTHGEYHSTQKSPQPPQFFPNIDYKSLTYMPTIHQSLPQPVPSTTTPLPLLSHLLLPLGPLLHSILQRLNELQSQPLRIYPSSLSIISSQQPVPVQQSSLQQNPLSDMFGIVTGTAGSSQQQPQQSQQNERLITVDSKEIYTRRVLQVIGELHGIMMCTQHQFIDPKSTPTEVAKSVHPASSSSTTSTSSSATSTQNDSSSDPLGLWDESLDGDNNNVDHINIQLHPWHYTTTPSLTSTNSSTDIVPYPTDSDHTLKDLETNLQEYPFFNEIWKDITLLLNHVGTLLYQQSTPSAAANGVNTAGKTQTGTSSAPIRQLTSILQETPSNALVMTKRVAQLFDTLLPSLEQAQVQQQQQLALQRNKQQTPQQQHYANMLLVPQSYAFNLIMTNHHRKYVLDTMMKTIASQIGQEKRGGGDFMDLLGFGSEELGMLQSLLGGGDAGGDDDLKNMLSLLNPGADLGPSGKSGKSADVGGSAPLPGLAGGSEDEQLMQLLSALGGGGDSAFSGAGDLSALLGGPPTPSTRIPAAGKAKKTATGKGAKKATPVVKKAAATTNTNTDTPTTTTIAQSPPLSDP